MSTAFSKKITEAFLTNCDLINYENKVMYLDVLPGEMCYRSKRTLTCMLGNFVIILFGLVRFLVQNQKN